MDLQKKLTAASYVRVSTLLQGQSVENQLVPIRQFCANRNFNLVFEYSDEGISGAKDRRPALDKLLADARKGKFKVLVVAGLCRLGRNVKHLLTLLDELSSLGVKFISLRESIDLSTPQGVMTMQVLAAVAQLERELIRQRVRESLAAKKLIAQQTGSGWRCGRKAKVNPAIIAKVIQLRNEGQSIRQIERTIGKEISRGSILRILQSCHKTASNSEAEKAIKSTIESPTHYGVMGVTPPVGFGSDDDASNEF